MAAAGLVVTTITAVILFVTLRPVTLRIAVASVSEDAKMVEAIARVFTRERSSVRLLLTVMEQGQAEALLNTGGADLAVVRSDAMPSNCSAIAVLRKRALFVWTATSPGQKTSRGIEWKNVTGSKIAMLNGSPADHALLNVVLASEGATPGKVEILTLGSMDAMAVDKSISVFATVGVIKSKTIAEGFRSFSRLREVPNFLGLETADAIILRQPQLETAEIPKAAFASGPAFPAEAVSVISFSDLVVGSKALSEQAAAAFARELFAHRQTILREILDTANIEKPNTEKDAAIPAHPGVAAYIDGTERTFLERYGDYFWGSILVLSALGSFGAGLRAFFHPDEQENVSALRDRVLDLAAKVRDSTGEDLVPIEKEIQHIVRETLDKYEEGAIEEGALAALGLAIEQFRAAAAGRIVG
ncbi:TRAP transporter substrate-binding protein [Bradyrhizobium sp.]|uniref:TRAP transporter substrate-binding protein n=1 Tax=Bradyrhizobium sp. TaxID=376 RepID=UPI00273571CB|nr:TRAP transporter substrate-binding protein [Bradyrhizobium sp.]MDP3077062.1 TRAP transporter substrate-binding protein [Bradyrhizobium sp.]